MIWFHTYDIYNILCDHSTSDIISPLLPFFPFFSFSFLSFFNSLLLLFSLLLIMIFLSIFFPIRLFFFFLLFLLPSRISTRERYGKNIRKYSRVASNRGAVSSVYFSFVSSFFRIAFLFIWVSFFFRVFFSWSFFELSFFPLEIFLPSPFHWTEIKTTGTKIECLKKGTTSNEPVEFTLTWKSGRRKRGEIERRKRQGRNWKGKK